MPRSHRPWPLLASLWLLLALGRAAAADPAPTPTFQHHVLPIFKARCGSCHLDKARGGLDLRTLAAILTGGDSGPAIQPGKTADSLLWQRIETGEMPPKGSTPLSEAERMLIRRWIDYGRFDLAQSTPGKTRTITPEQRNFWSFRRPMKLPVPTVKKTERVRTPIDAYVQHRLEAKGLTLGPDTAPEKLLRRLYFDVIGLPPTPAELAAFAQAANRQPQAALEEVVDRLLASPHYGERWARHWLDVVGYADSNGRRGDEERINSWRYRDWVIRALNEDMPYNQFVTEQLAGDELVDWRHADVLTADMVGKLVATGFLRCAPDATDNEQVDERDDRYETLHDTVEIVGRSLFGLTVGCAKCHDHKYDPILQSDFYRLEACFQPAYDPANWLPANKRSFRSDNLRYLPEAGRLELARFKEKNQAIDNELKRLQQQSKEIIGRLRQAPELAPEAAKIKAAIAAQTKLRPAAPQKLWVLWDMNTQAPVTRLLKRGDFKTPGAPVAPGVLSVLDDPHEPFPFPGPDQKLGTTGRRRALAAWITRPDHPLTARVLVNRVWQHHFGKGLVRTPDDFGAAGARPTHPELLDWLAATFIEEGWSLKKLHRHILLSTVYQQSAAFRQSSHEVDPGNELLWRKVPLRLEAEVLRDTMLAVSGTLNAQVYGKPVPVKKAPDGQFVVAGSGPEAARRSIYLLNKRSESLTFLNTFDAPVMELNCPERFQATVPLQALTLMNNTFVREQGQALAARALREAGAAVPRQVELAFRLTLGRSPSVEELSAVSTFLQRQTRGNAAPAARLMALTNLCHTLLGTNEFLYVD